MPVEKQCDVDEVLQRAMSAFWARGYWSTSIQDLVHATGVNRASLYLTYGDKRSLFLAALRRCATSVHFRRLADLEAQHPPLEVIAQALLAFTPGPRSTADNRGCFLTNTALELSAHDPEAAEIVERAQRQTQAFFERMIRRAKSEGSLRPGVKVAEAAEALLASLIGLSVLNRSCPDPALTQRIVTNTMRQLH